jgi:hypothetical protein
MECAELARRREGPSVAGVMFLCKEGRGSGGRERIRDLHGPRRAAPAGVPALAPRPAIAVAAVAVAVAAVSAAVALIALAAGVSAAAGVARRPALSLSRRHSRAGFPRSMAGALICATPWASRVTTGEVVYLARWRARWRARSNVLSDSLALDFLSDLIYLARTLDRWI